MTTVISILSRKGGGGKTVTAIYLAHLLAEREHDVAALDKDPEGTALAWARPAGTLPFRVRTEGDAAQAMKHAVVVIDTPPNDARALSDAARVAQHVIVVAKCNALEADRLAATLDALAASGYSGRWGILLTQSRGALGREMTEALEAEDLPVLGVIPHSVRFERAFGLVPDNLDDYRQALASVLP